MSTNVEGQFVSPNDAKPLVSSRLLLRIAADLQKEYVRQTDDMVKADLEIQIEGLKALHKEVEDYRTIKRLLNGC